MLFLKRKVKMTIIRYDSSVQSFSVLCRTATAFAETSMPSVFMSFKSFFVDRSSEESTTSVEGQANLFALRMFLQVDNTQKVSSF